METKDYKNMSVPRKIIQALWQILVVVILIITFIPKYIFFFIIERGFGAFLGLLLWCSIGTAITVVGFLFTRTFFCELDSIFGGIICGIVTIFIAFFTIVGAIEITSDCDY